MALTHISSGEITSVQPLGAKLETTPSQALFKDAHLEVMRIVLPAGKRMPEHAVAGSITVQCVEGEVSVSTGNAVSTLHAGELLYLAGGVPHALHAISNASLLVTISLNNA